MAQHVRFNRSRPGLLPGTRQSKVRQGPWVTGDGSSGQTITNIMPTAAHSATVILLHGLGGRGVLIGQHARRMSSHPELAHVKWVLPDAPLMESNASPGSAIPSWFDVHGRDVSRREESESSLFAAAASIHALIQLESAHVPPERILVGGHSQGGGLACLVGITSICRLAGVFVLSAFVPLLRKTRSIMTPVAPSIPIYWAHGTNDQLINHELAYTAASHLARVLQIPFQLLIDRVLAPNGENESGEVLVLNAADPGIRFNRYSGMGHSIDPGNEIADLEAWIRAVVPANVPVGMSTSHTT